VRPADVEAAGAEDVDEVVVVVGNKSMDSVAVAKPSGHVTNLFME
jgi:hypothetical protein